MTPEWMQLYGKLILFIVFMKILQSPSVKGWVGELIVKLQLKRLDKEKYMIVNDVTLKLEDGKTAQIDHIVVSEYGVFVIETKNYKGWIVGKENDHYWKQIIYKRKEKLYNPLKQNEVHIERLKELLNHIPDIPFVSIVVFTGRADIKVETTKHLIYSWKLPKVIESYLEKLMNKSKSELIHKSILDKKIIEREVKKEHVQKIKEFKKDIETIENHCPRCNGELKVRNGKRGQFKGCSSFPKCRYTEAL